MIIYKLYKESLSITAHRQRVDDKKIDFYSFDQQTAKIIVQIKSTGDGKALEAVQDVLIALERGGKKAVHNMTVEDYNENLVSFVLPDNIISQSGSFLCGIYLDYGNNKSLDVGYFRINLKQSLIDKDLPAMEQFYVQSFEELKGDIIQRSSDLQAIIDGIDTDVSDKLKMLDDLVDDYAQKAEELESTYAPNLTDVIRRLGDTMNKTSVTLNHKFSDTTERDSYFADNEDELTELVFIKVGAGYQQYIQGEWTDASPILTEAVNQIDDEGVSSEKTYSSEKLTEELIKKVDVMSIKNLVKNGDFSQGSTGWNTTSSGSIIDNELVVTRHSSRWSQSIQGSIDEIIYFSAKIHTLLLNGTTGASINISDGSFVTLFNNPTSAPTIKSAIRKLTTVNPVLSVSSWRSGETVDERYDDILVVNLTQTFGAGNEPSKEEMDILVDLVPGNWWDGELQLEQKLIIQWLLKLEREKANRKQEDWITPTLLNGWEPFDSNTYSTPGFYKDNFGVVHLKGLLKTGARNTHAFVLPLTYRPSRIVYETSRNSSQTVATPFVNSDGRMFPTSTDYVGYIILNGISFRAEA